MFRARIASLKIAFLTWPDKAAWLKCAAIFAAYASLAAGIGFPTGFLKLELMNGPAGLYIALPLVLFLRPALIEEVFFRGLLLPHPRECAGRRSLLCAAALSLAAFVLMHPLNGMTFRPEAFPVYSHPVFLVLAALLGIACTVAYQTSGSIWPPILCHWFSGALWTLFLGGKRLLAGE